MRPQQLKTRIFLDGGNTDETEEAIRTLGFLDGQTTNPTLISKNPGIRERIQRGEKFTPETITEFYRQTVNKISVMVPRGSVSIEVFSDRRTKAEQMLKQGREMFGWIPNAHIKFPTSAEGLKAASIAVKEGMRVNMTLCFTQSQAAAVYAATRGARRGDVFVSPFIGRLDDKGEKGMDLIANILKMYSEGDGHVEVLTASVRSVEHVLAAVALGTDILTAPFEVLKSWSEEGLPVPGEGYKYAPPGLKAIRYQKVDLSKDWPEYDIKHELTDKGMERFSQDWNSLIK